LSLLQYETEALDPFSLVADELSQLGAKMRDMVASEVPKLAQAAEYFFRMGAEGKRFRPTVSSAPGRSEAEVQLS
jgi:geranyl diphosphate synthase